jgi:hypothetical protein
MTDHPGNQADSDGDARPSGESGRQECDYCGRSKLTYEMRSNRGVVNRCIPCLALEQAQQQLKMPFDEFTNESKHEESPIWDDQEDWDNHRRHSYESARDWLTVLARIQDDEPIVKRDPDAIGATLSEDSRESLINIMGSEAHKTASEVAGSEVHATQVKLGDCDE